MASTPGAGGPRHVGRVVDPDVREDGEADPELELNATAVAPAEAPREHADSFEKPGATAAPAAEDFAPTEEDFDAIPARGQAVRERLLAKARAAEQRADPTEGSDLDAIGRPADEHGAEEDELRLPLGRPPAAPLPSGRGELSPSVVALFAALVGMATIASLTALFMSFERKLPATIAAPAASSAAVAAPSAAPPAEPRAKAKRARQKVPGPWRIADAKSDARYRYVEGKVGTDPFIKALAKTGVEEGQAYRVVAAMRGVFDLDKCNKNDRFAALVDRQTKRLFAFEYLVTPEEVYQAKENEGRLSGYKLDLKVERGQVAGSLVYDGRSFDRSAELAGFDPGLSKVVARALDGHMSLDELDRGDTLRVIVQEQTVLGEFARYTGVEALELDRLDPKKTSLRVYYYDAPNVRGYYDKDGRAPYEGGWRKPIKDAPRTSPFNPKRMHPVLHKVMPHNGTDFGASVGTPVGASSFGTVSFLGWGGPAGNLVKILHPGGVETGYAHLSRFAEGLKVGDKVKRMQLIGYVGNTGRSTGPHLHFSASRDGKFFDAETLNLDGMRVITPSERGGFVQLLAKYDPLLDAIPLPEPLAPLPDSTAKPAEPTVVAAAPSDPSESEDDHDTPPPPPPAAAPAGAAPPAANTPASHTGSSVYLTDEELRQLQGATDDGEVD